MLAVLDVAAGEGGRPVDGVNCDFLGRVAFFRGFLNMDQSSMRDAKYGERVQCGKVRRLHVYHDKSR